MTHTKEIEFLPVCSNHSKGIYENVNYLVPILTEYEKYTHIFEDDWWIPPSDYEGWISEKMQCVNALYPWFFAVTYKGEFVGWVWADKWQGSPSKPYSCSVSVVAKRKTNISENSRIFRKFLEKIFTETSVYIIRFETSSKNKACLWGMKRMGFKHFDECRAWQVVNGQEVTGIIGSMTKPEFEELNHGQV